MAIGLTSGDPTVALRCVKGIAQLLSCLLDVYVSPIERFEVADQLVLVFSRIREAGTCGRCAMPCDHRNLFLNLESEFQLDC